jgi:hypothetical protein
LAQGAAAKPIVECLTHEFHWKTAAASFFYFMDYWRAFAPENIQSPMVGQLVTCNQRKILPALALASFVSSEEAV